MFETTFSYYTKQLSFDYSDNQPATSMNYRDALVELLSDDLDFHNHSSRYATHNFHAFPAKFPPQLPAKFILSLTEEGDVVLDPMMRSGTTIVEAFLSGRQAIGFDIDPLAVKIAKVKTDRLTVKELMKIFKSILNRAKARIKDDKDLKNEFSSRWDSNTRQFVDYWFTKETQIELMALLSEIREIQDEKMRTFFEVALSATIITKSGGVSLALDLAHTRPHKAKIVLDKDGKAVFGEESYRENSSHLRHHTKKLRSAFDEFEKRCFQNMKGILKLAPGKLEPDIRFGNAQDLPLQDDSVDLIVTSPPYASNAIDYMRAHKFSLIWLGYSIDSLGKKRKEYIGGEETNNWEFEQLPAFTSKIVAEIVKLDKKRGKVLHRYYSEMKKTLQEMFRVLKPDKSAIVVVGNSIMRGKDTQTQNCLAEIGMEVGFQVPQIGIRQLDRNKRMLPAGATLDTSSQIQQRMHEEYVIGFYKSAFRKSPQCHAVSIFFDFYPNIERSPCLKFKKILTE